MVMNKEEAKYKGDDEEVHYVMVEVGWLFFLSLQSRMS